MHTTIPITDTAQRVALGTLSASANAGATVFPERTNLLLSIVSFVFTLSHATPIADSDRLAMGFGPGGRSDLPYLQGGTYFSLAPGRTRQARTTWRWSIRWTRSSSRSR